MLQFITDSKAPTPVAEQIKQFIKGGGRWVQIRMPEAEDNDVRAVVEEVKQLCIDTETFLILNDRAELAKELNVGGVFLEKGDILPSKARLLLGPAAVVGVLAHNIDEIKAVRSLDIDYIALAPFRADDSEELGLEGLTKLCTQMESLEINIGHVALGGIKLDDINSIMTTGVNGIAVSSAIARTKDIEASTVEWLKALKPFELSKGEH